MNSIAAAAAQGARGFFAWWIGELAGLLPRALRESLARGSDATLLRASRRKAELFVQKSGGLERIAEAEAIDRELSGKEVQDAFWPALRRRSGPLIALLHETQTLETRLSLPLAAADAPREAVRYQIGRFSPFREEDVLFDARVVSRNAAEKTVSVQIHLAPKAAVAGARAQAEAWGLPVDRVALAAGGDGADPSLVYLDASRAKPRMAGRIVDGALAAALCCVLAAVVAWPYWRQESAIRRLTSEIAAVKPKAEAAGALRRQMDNASLVAGRVTDARTKTPSALAVLARLAEILPDGVWLTEYRMRGAAVTIAGAAPDATKLLSIVEGAGEFSGAKFVSATSRDEARALDRFSMSFGVSAP